MDELIGAIEAGGTKFVCAIGRTWQEARDRSKGAKPIATRSPEITWPSVVAYFAEQCPRGERLAAIGVGSFGPLDLSRQTITDTTPKQAWRGFGWQERTAELADHLVLDTDVGAAALAEHLYGAARDARPLIYVTVGTGVGGGVIIDGATIGYPSHPEIGHMRIPRSEFDSSDRLWPGNCSLHGDCLEGLASGEAMTARWNCPPAALDVRHRGWTYEAEYLALAVTNLLLVLAPQRIVLGGGVMEHAGLLERVQRRSIDLLNGYIVLGHDPARTIKEVIVAPALGADAGIVGAFELANRWLHGAGQSIG